MFYWLVYFPGLYQKSRYPFLIFSFWPVSAINNRSPEFENAGPLEIINHSATIELFRSV